VSSHIEAKREKYRRYAEKIAVFNGLPPEFVRQVIHAGENITYQQGGVITREGIACTAMFIVIKGQVSLYEKGVFLRRCGTGESFCELGVLLKDYKSSSAVADMETQMLGLEDHVVRKFFDMGEGKRFMMNFLRVLCEYQLASNERLLQLHLALGNFDEAASDRIARRAFEVKAKTVVG